MQYADGFSVHFIGQNRQMVSHVSSRSDKAAGFLNHPRMPDREWRDDSPSDDDNGHCRDEYSEAGASIVIYAGEHLIHIAPEPSEKDHCHVDKQKEREI